MKTKKLLSFLLTITTVVSMMATIGVTANAGQAATLHAEATCDKYPDAKHVLVTAVDASNVTFTLYDIDGTKTENQTLPVSYFSEQPTVGEWCFGYFMYYGKCDGNHEKSGGNETDTFLDLDDSTTDIKEKKELDQNYKLTVTNNYTDMTKVKVEWTVTDITATRKDAKVWNPDTLSWVDDNENDVVTPGDTTASFKITNLSTVKVDAKVEFAAETGFTPEAVYTGVDATTHKTTVNTVVKADKSVDNTITHDVTVAVKVTPAKADFADKTATTTATKYGTYTVTISKATAD